MRIVNPQNGVEYQALASIVGAWAHSLGAPGARLWAESCWESFRDSQGSRLTALAEDDGAPIGFASAAIVQPLPWPARTDRGWASLDGLFVEPAHRREGTATQLVQELRRQASELKLRKFEVNADPAARDFYSTMGFAPVGNAMKWVL